MTREQKEIYLHRLTDELTGLKGAVIAEYRGTNVAAMERIRRRLFELGIDFGVIKNSLFKRAIVAAGLTEPAGDFLDAPIALASSHRDEVEVARALRDLNREFDTLVPVAGIIDGQCVGAAVVACLAALPSRDELLGQVVSGLAGLTGRMTRAINNPLRSLAAVALAIKQTREAV